MWNQAEFEKLYDKVKALSTKSSMLDITFTKQPVKASVRRLLHKKPNDLILIHTEESVPILTIGSDMIENMNYQLVTEASIHTMNNLENFEDLNNESMAGFEGLGSQKLLCVKDQASNEDSITQGKTVGSLIKPNCSAKVMKMEDDERVWKLQKKKKGFEPERNLLEELDMKIREKEALKFHGAQEMFQNWPRASKGNFHKRQNSYNVHLDELVHPSNKELNEVFPKIKQSVKNNKVLLIKPKSECSTSEQISLFTTITGGSLCRDEALAPVTAIIGSRRVRGEGSHCQDEIMRPRYRIIPKSRSKERIYHSFLDVKFKGRFDQQQQEKQEQQYLKQEDSNNTSSVLLPSLIIENKSLSKEPCLKKGPGSSLLEAKKAWPLAARSRQGYNGDIGDRIYHKDYYLAYRKENIHPKAMKQYFGDMNAYKNGISKGLIDPNSLLEKSNSSSIHSLMMMQTRKKKKEKKLISRLTSLTEISIEDDDNDNNSGIDCIEEHEARANAFKMESEKLKNWMYEDIEMFKEKILKKLGEN